MAIDKMRSHLPNAAAQAIGCARIGGVVAVVGQAIEGHRRAPGQHHADDADEHDKHIRAAKCWSLTEARREEEGGNESGERVTDNEQ